jgi:hypothetical protein
VFGVGAGVVKCGCIGCGCGIGRMWMDADVRYRAISCDAVRERATPCVSVRCHVIGPYLKIS